MGWKISRVGQKNPDISHWRQLKELTKPIHIIDNQCVNIHFLYFVPTELLLLGKTFSTNILSLTGFNSVRSCILVENDPVPQLVSSVRSGIVVRKVCVNLTPMR